MKRSMLNSLCGAVGPNEVAGRTPSQGAAGAGGANRRSPTGGAAYGMPLKTSTPSRSVPSTAPWVVRTIVAIRSTVDHDPGASHHLPVGGRYGRSVVVALVLVVLVAVASVVGLVATRRELGGARRSIQQLRSDLSDAAQAREDAERALASARDDIARHDALVHSLWSLDLLRVGREWAAAGGAHDDSTVAVDTGAELAMALRLTLERQREETGVPGEVAAADLDGVPVATALAALRIAEELLAVVSRPSEGVAVRLAVATNGVVVTISLDATDADVPPVVRALVERAGASITVDGPTVTVRVSS